MRQSKPFVSLTVVVPGTAGVRWPLRPPTLLEASKPSSCERGMGFSVGFNSIVIC